MKAESGIPIQTLRVDGGPTRDSFLMQFQADMADVTVLVPDIEELSGMGPAYVAGIALGLYDPVSIFDRPQARSIGRLWIRNGERLFMPAGSAR